MNEPLVSLLMISYNNVQFLKAAIDSVLNQTYQNWELIISDDRSTDGAWELAQVLSKIDVRIKVYQNKVNLGIPKNRKVAYEKSSGDFIAHIDGDDILFPYSVQSMVKHLNENPDAMLAQSDSVFIDPKNKVMSYNCNKDPEENLVHFGWRHFGMYRKEVMQHIDGYNDKIRNACEDGDLFMQIADKFPFIRVAEVLYKHRWHPENQSHKNDKCADCLDRPVCNFIKIWAKHAKIDHITMKPLGDYIWTTASSNT